MALAFFIFIISILPEMSNLHIEQIRPELTWKLRQQVMYSEKKVTEMAMAEDQEGYHYAAFKDNYIVAVVSLFQEGTDFQFRKFAVDNTVQGQGIGKALLEYIVNLAIAEGAIRIWCNARVAAIGFYAKYGFTVNGDIFTKNGIDYQVMEKRV